MLILKLVTEILILWILYTNLYMNFYFYSPLLLHLIV